MSEAKKQTQHLPTVDPDIERVRHTPRTFDAYHRALRDEIESRDDRLLRWAFTITGVALLVGVFLYWLQVR